MRRLELGWATRAAAGQRVCGDLVVQLRSPDATTVAVIDGVGHGPRAAAAADQAAELVRAHARLELEALFHRCDRELRGSRGVSMTVIRIAHASLALEHLGVGDVSLAGLTQAQLQAKPRPGQLGGRVRKLELSHHPLHPGDRLLLHSDGISSRLDLSLLRGPDPGAIAKTVLARHGRSHDDASCVVVFVYP